MKHLKIMIIIIVFGLLTSCEEAGTMISVDGGKNPNIEVYKYYIDGGDYVYVARFKDCSNVVATTWQERQGKMSYTKGNVTVYENDSIKVILKK